MQSIEIVRIRITGSVLLDTIRPRMCPKQSNEVELFSNSSVLSLKLEAKCLRTLERDRIDLRRSWSFTEVSQGSKCLNILAKPELLNSLSNMVFKSSSSALAVRSYKLFAWSSSSDSSVVSLFGKRG